MPDIGTLDPCRHVRSEKGVRMDTGRRHRRVVPLAMLLFALGLVSSACGWDSVLVEETPAAGNVLRVEMSDTAITPDHLTADKGDVTFEVTNNGTRPHNLTVTMGPTERHSPDIAPGTTASWTVEFPRTGQYSVYSSIGDDHEAGMEAMVLIRTD